MTTDMSASENAAPESTFADATTDVLTGISNRRFFEHRLNEQLASSLDSTTRITVLLLDLDRFKAVNDSLGHAVGDILLCLVTQRIASVLDARDSFARLGGDEFGIILGSDRVAEEVCIRIIELIKRAYLIEGCPVHIGVSIGIAVAPDDAVTRSTLMRCADLALYQAKAVGRSCHMFFEPIMAIKAQEKRELEIELRKSIVLRQLELHYHPQIEVTSRKLIAFEAVIRWKHPKRGLLDGNKFLPLAEEIGMIVPIGEWAVKAACREASRWSEDVAVAISISPLQFDSPRFFEVVKAALEGSGVLGQKLELEVTEGILLRDEKTVLAALESLRSIGVRVAVDSFGTGIASLSQMVNFPLDKIKIARSLVQETGTGIRERAIVRAVAALGASLGITTMVEGVNTEEHLTRIQMDGCSSLQGYLVSNAVTADRLPALVEDLLASSSTHQST